MAPHCVRIRCNAPIVPQNGFVVGYDFLIGDTVVYLCDEGFELDGEMVRSCLSNGSWSDEMPKCNSKIYYLSCYI